MISILNKLRVKTLHVNSVAGVREQVRQLSFAAPGEAPLLHLVLHDPQIVLRPFCIKEASVPQALRKLRLEVVELMGLPLEEFRLAVQVLHSGGKFVSGIYLTAINKKLQEYFDVLEENRLSVCRISTPVIEQINALNRQLGGFTGRICLVDLSSAGKAAIVVFFGQECELVREIICGDNLAAVKNEIIQSLRSVCSRSENKNVDKIFIAGQDAGLEELSEFVEERLHIRVQSTPGSIQGEDAGEGQSFISLNLAEDLSLSYDLRRKILLGTNLLIAFLLLCDIAFLPGILMKEYKIRRARATISVQQYQYAVDVYNKVKEGKNEK